MKSNNQKIQKLENKNKKNNLLFSLIIGLGLPITITPVVVMLTLFSGMMFATLAALILVGGMFGFTLLLNSVKEKIEKNNQEIAKLRINESANDLSNEEVELAKSVLKARESLAVTESLTQFLNSNEEFSLIKDTINNARVMKFLEEIEENKTIDFLYIYNHDEFNFDNSHNLSMKKKEKIKTRFRK